MLNHYAIPARPKDKSDHGIPPVIALRFLTPWPRVTSDLIVHHPAIPGPSCLLNVVAPAHLRGLDLSAGRDLTSSLDVCVACSLVSVTSQRLPLTNLPETPLAHPLSPCNLHVSLRTPVTHVCVCRDAAFPGTVGSGTACFTL